MSQNKDLSFSIHKIDKTEKTPPKNKDLRFPQTKKIALKKKNLPLKYSLRCFLHKFAPN